MCISILIVQYFCHAVGIALFKWAQQQTTFHPNEDSLATWINICQWEVAVNLDIWE